MELLENCCGDASKLAFAPVWSEGCQGFNWRRDGLRWVVGLMALDYRKQELSPFVGCGLGNPNYSSSIGYHVYPHPNVQYTS